MTNRIASHLAALAAVSATALLAIGCAAGPEDDTNPDEMPTVVDDTISTESGSCSCPAGMTNEDGLCYTPCTGGYKGVGPVCWQTCASDFTDTGAFCQRDTSIVSANTSKCPWYNKCGLGSSCSKCPSGYSNDGCTCRRDAQMFYKGSYGRGAGSPMSCNSSLQYDGGLCYTPCASGYNGVGPVCWGSCPATYTIDDGALCRQPLNILTKY